MRGHEHKSGNKMNEIRTPKLEPLTNKMVMTHCSTFEDSRSGQLARASFGCFALPICSW